MKNYENKYLKYKNKYIEYKKNNRIQYGGIPRGVVRGNIDNAIIEIHKRKLDGLNTPINIYSPGGHKIISDVYSIYFNDKKIIGKNLAPKKVLDANSNLDAIQNIMRNERPVDDVKIENNEEDKSFVIPGGSFSIDIVNIKQLDVGPLTYLKPRCEHV